MTNNDTELRQQLMEARETVVRQIEILQNPIRFYDKYPEGITKLRNTLAEIEEALAHLNAKAGS
jgi:hypothetical protein